MLKGKSFREYDSAHGKSENLCPAPGHTHATGTKLVQMATLDDVEKSGVSHLILYCHHAQLLTKLDLLLVRLSRTLRENEIVVLSISQLLTCTSFHI